MSTTQFSRLFNVAPQGLFFLKNELVDNTTPHRLEAIMEEVSKVIDIHQETDRAAFSPVFTFLNQNNGTRIRLAISKPNGTVVGNVDLYPANDEGLPGQSLALVDHSWQALEKKRHVAIQLSTLSKHVRKVAKHLNDTKAWSLRYQMSMLERLTVERPKTVSFDLDINEHGVTIVAYVKGILFGSIFVAA